MRCGTEDVLIRRYKIEDHESVRQIACDTAFMGEPCEIFFEDREVLADFLTLYFTDYEPESCFIAEIDGEIAGYIIGSKDTRILNNVFLAKILPVLIARFIRKGVLAKRKNRAFLFRLLISGLKGEFRQPDFSKEYPAVLHINLREKYRGRGLGAKLISVFLEYLNKQRVTGVHFAALSEEAARFFKKNGFQLLHKNKRTYFRNILNVNLNCYTFGKKLV